LWLPSYSSLDLWKLPGKIRLQELVSSNSKNISCVAFLTHGGLAEGVITTPEAIMMDWTGWSSPIGAARQTERNDNS
jgi:hypothetical protein